MHRRFAPEGEVAALLYDSLEELRVETVGCGADGRACAPIWRRATRPAGPAAGRASAARTPPWPRSSSCSPASSCWASSSATAQQKLLASLERLARARPSPASCRRSATCVDDQEAFARRVRELLAHLGLSEELAEPPDAASPTRTTERRSSSRPRAATTSSRGRGPRARSSSESSAQAEREQRRRPGDRGPRRAPARPSDESEAEQGGEDDVGATTRTQPAALPPARRRCRWPTGSTPTQFDEVVDGRGAVRPVRARPAARPARPVADPLPGHDRPDGEPAAAQAAGAAAALLAVRPRRGPARHRPAVAGRHQPDDTALLQAGEGDRLPRHRGDPADRQFGLDARPADRRCGDECRHPRPHARALRRQGRDPGLHHPRLEGRPVARGLAARRQARRARPAQRPAPHRLQAGRRALAPRPALAWA